MYYPSWKQSQFVYKQNYDKCFAGENFTVYDEVEILENTVYLENSFYNIKIANETSYVAVFSKDVTAKVLYDKKLNQNLIEKELLLKEIHHRVKNNMQIIIGLLQLQELYVNDEKINPIFNDINNRVKAMSLVHELLYQSDDLSFIDFNSYVVKLCMHISSSYKESASKVEFVFESQPHFLTIDTAIPLGLLVNELLTNALKYAFKGRENGKIELGVKEENDKFVFYFSDNGIGLPQSIDFENANTLGLNLIHRLASQINAELEIITTKGTTFYLTLDTKN
jgi:two-component sensor histidine kinase